MELTELEEKYSVGVLRGNRENTNGEQKIDIPSSLHSTRKESGIIVVVRKNKAV